MRLKSLCWLLAGLLVSLIAGALLLAVLVGIPISGLPTAPAVGAGLAAKLACSGRFVSRFDESRVAADLEIFSPALAWAALDYSVESRVRSSLLGASASARYYPGVGCTLQRAGMFPISSLALPAVEAPAALLNTSGARNPGLQAAVAAAAQQDIAEGLDTRALLVVKDGQLLAEFYAPGVSADTPLMGWSMGKSLTALAAGRMQALGLLSTAERELFPEWEGDERSAISLENLLQMSSGLAFSEAYIPGSDATRMLFTAPDASKVALAQPLEAAPGTRFSYSSGSTNLVCRLLTERLGGPQAWVDFFAREVVQPLGLENTVMELDPSGRCVGSSYVYASARDWARMALPLLAGGRAGAQQWLQAGWVEHAVRPNRSANEPRYGYQLWLNRGGERPWWPSLPDDAFAMSGHNGQVVMLLPSLRMILVRLGWNTGEYPVDRRFGELLALQPGAAAVNQ